MIIALKVDNFSTAVQLDARVLANALDEVARHSAGQLSAADQHVYAGGVLRKQYGSLSGGIGAAHHRHFLAPAKLRINEGCAIVDAFALELLEICETRF